MLVTINVTAEDLQADPQNFKDCPVFRAMGRMVEVDEVWVYSFFPKGESLLGSYKVPVSRKLPEWVGDNILQLIKNQHVDRGTLGYGPKDYSQVAPFSFLLDIEPQFVRVPERELVNV